MLNNLHKLFSGPAAIRPVEWQSFLSTSRLIRDPSSLHPRGILASPKSNTAYSEKTATNQKSRLAGSP